MGEGGGRGRRYENVNITTSLRQRADFGAECEQLWIRWEHRFQN